MLLMSATMSVDLDFTAMRPLCTAAPGFGGITRVLSPRCDPGCGKSAHAVVFAHM